MALYDIYDDIDIVLLIKIQRLRWMGHVVRMNNSKPVRKVFESEPALLKSLHFRALESGFSKALARSRCPGSVPVRRPTSETEPNCMLRKYDIELKCTEEDIKCYIGVLLYMGVLKIPKLKMAWAKELKLTAIANAVTRKGLGN